MIIKLLITLLVIINQIIITPNQKQIDVTNKDTNIKEDKTNMPQKEANKVIEYIKDSIVPDKKEEPIAYLTIESISLHNVIYNKESPNNNIEKNVTILTSSNNPESNDSLIVLAAHSGEGKIAYFNNLDKLKIDNEIKYTYQNKDYIFTITKIYEQEKNGYINIPKNEKSQLILTTCSTKNKNKQLIIESTLKEP